MHLPFHQHDKHQILRLKRHLLSSVAIALFTLINIYFYVNNYFVIDNSSVIAALLILWTGQMTIFLLIYSNRNLSFSDPSLTLLQMTWATIFALYFSYALKDMRDIMLVSYLGILSFGFFKLSPKQFIIHATTTLTAYFFIVIYIYINEPLRIHVAKEVIQLVVFSVTCFVLVYTGSAVSRLRALNNRHTEELENALELNMLLAVTDDLTGLYTRSYLMDVIDQQKARADRENNDFFLLFADLDHFKAINDTYGHHTGDAVLEDFSEILKKSIREVDYASRFGGEEFVLVLVNTDMEQAKMIAERIRETLEKHNFSDVAPNLRVTVSIGAASYQEFSSIQETLQYADKRMYKAKEEGRNRCVFSE